MARYDGTQATTKHAAAREKRQQQAYLILDHLRRAASEGHEMSPAAIQAAKIFLAKTLPDLKAVEHSGETTQNLNLNPDSFIFGIAGK